MTAESSVATAQASVLFLKILAAAAASEPSQQRAKLDVVLAACISVWPDAERVVLDAPDGAAIVAMGDPGLALKAASRAQQAAQDAELLMVLHHGPVGTVQGEASEMRLSGDGIDAAIGMAQGAGDARMLVSASFRDALARWSPARARALTAAGEWVDARGRTYLLFTFDSAAAVARERRRTVLKVAGIASVLALGFTGRVVRGRIAAANKPAVIVLDIRPWGEVYIDGEMKGRTPPLSRLWIKPGAHTVELRNGKFKPMTLEVELKPGEELELKHVFVSAPVKKKGLWERLKFW